jgi:glyoxylase-like metal-dependent hydrolase (beta-lactamase superfamily II)
MRKIIFAVLCCGALWTSSAKAQDFDKVEIKAEKLADGIYMLTGSGGNIGVGVGDEAVFIIDDQYAPLTPKILAAIAKLSDKPVKFVLNSHWHGDHTGGNENMGKAGAVIIAQDNVRKRMSSAQFIEAFNMRTDAAPPVALPVVTFAESVTLHLNGEDVYAFHVPNAHTDGDTIFRFQKSNAIHMGDTYFNGMYPFIDVATGGSVDGVIAAANRALSMIDGNTKVIPGHGPLGDKASLTAYRDMLVAVGGRVKAGVKAGKTMEQVMKDNPGKGYDETWGNGFLKPEKFFQIAYQSYSATNAEKSAPKKAAKK